MHAAAQRHQMSERKDKRLGVVIFTCNAVGCGASHSVKATSPAAAWPLAKREGWIAWRRGNIWLHFCSWIHRGSYESDLKTKNAQAGKSIPDMVRDRSAIERGELVKGVDFD
jgi:hypothetical protein